VVLYSLFQFFISVESELFLVAFEAVMYRMYVTVGSPAVLCNFNYDTGYETVYVTGTLTNNGQPHY
jgi:hypothetical protein